MKKVDVFFFRDVEEMSEEQRVRAKLPDWRRQTVKIDEDQVELVKLIRDQTSSIKITDLQKIADILSTNK